MKSKKLISFLCAAAMTVSSFASLAVTASAADDSLFSNSFNGNTTGVFLDGTTANAATDSDNVVPGLTFVTTNRGDGDRSTYQDNDNNTVYSGSYYAIIDRAANDNALRLSFPQFADFESANSRWAHVQIGDGTYAATATEDLVMDFDLKYTAGMIKGVEDTTYTPNLRVGTFFDSSNTKEVKALKIDSASVGYDTWKKVRVVVNNSTGAKLYIDGTEVTAAANSAVKAISDIGLYSPDGTSNGGYATVDYLKTDTSYKAVDAPTKSPVADVDNMVIYMAAAGTVNGSTATKTPEDVKGGQSNQEVIKPLEQVAGAAPCLVAPNGVQNLTTAGFENDATFSECVKAETTPFSLEGGKMIATIGTRGNGDDATTSVSVVDVTNGTKAVKLDGGKFSTAGRSPRLYPKDSLKVEDGETAVMGFSVYMGKSSDSSEPGFWLIDTNEVNDEIVKANDEDAKWNGKYDNSDSAAANWKGVFAYFTAKEIGEEDNYGFGSETSRGITLTPNAWHTVVVAVTADGAYRIFVDGEYRDEEKKTLSPRLKAENLAYGDVAYGAKNLPVIAAENSGTARYTSVLIDNVVAYKLPEDATLESKYLPVEGEAPTPAPATPTPEPIAEATMVLADTKTDVTITSDIDTKALLVRASYKEGGALEAIKVMEPLTLTANTPLTKSVLATGETQLTKGDKIMLWDGTKRMAPIAATITVTEGAAQSTPAPIPTAAPTAAPTQGPDATTAPGPDTTTAPGPDTTTAPTAEPTVAPTAAPKYAVTVASGITNGTASVNKTTAAEGEEVTITLTPNLGYNGTVTVADADGAAVTVTDSKFTMPAKAVTVTATFALKENVIFSSKATYLSRTGAITDLDNLTTQANTNYSDREDVFVGNTGNYNGIGLFHFDAPTIPADKEIATATFTFINIANDNKNNDRSIDVRGGVLKDGASIDYSTVTWRTFFKESTIGTAASTTNLFKADEGLQETGFPFVSANVLASKIALPKNESNAIHTADISTYAKAQVKAGQPITMVMTDATGGCHLQKVAMIEYTLQDKTYEAAVTAPATTDGTLAVDKAAYNKDETVTITVTAKPGRKVTGVKVMNGETEVTVTAGENGTYTFTMPEADVTVSATYDRADIATIVIGGDDTVANGTENEYTLTAKAADGTDLELTADELAAITWSLDEAAEGNVAVAGETPIVKDATDAKKATLTLTDDQAAGNTVVKAVIEGVIGTKTVEITRQTVYTVAAATGLTGGSIAVDKTKGIATAPIKVTVTPADGYQLKTLKYNVDDTDTPITKTGDDYTFQIPAATATTINVTAEFEKIDYTITDATAENAGGTITVPATAQVGDEVTVVVNADDGKELDTLTVVPTTEGSTTTITVTGNKFTMPAEAVTVTVTFGAVVPKYMEFADGKIKVVSVKAGTEAADKTYAQLKKTSTQAASGNFGAGGTNPDSPTSGYDNPLVYKEGLLFASQASVSGGKLSSGNTVAVFTVDGSSIDTANNKVILGFDTQCVVAGKNANISIAKLTSDSPVDIGSMTYTAMNAMDAATIGNQFTNGNTTKTTKTFDVTSHLNSEGVTYFALFTYTAREHAFSDFTLTVTPVYTATVNVTDGTNPLAGATVTLKSGENTVATQTSAETTGIATFAKLDAGTYTVEVSKDGYTSPATAPTLTVAADGTNSINVALEEITADPASLTVVYTTDGTADGAVASAEVYSLETGNKYADDKVAAADLASYKKTVKSATKDANGMYDYYAYASGLTDEITLEAGENKAYVTVTSLGKYNYYEDFNAMTEYRDWADANTVRTGAIGTEDNNKFVSIGCNDKGVGQLFHSLGDDAVTLTGKKVTVEYDVKNTLGTTGVLGGKVGLGDETVTDEATTHNVILSIGQTTNKPAMSYFTGGRFELGAENSGNYGSDANEATTTNVKADTFTATGVWYHVKIVIEGGKATLTVNTKGAEDAQSVENIEVTSTTLKYIKITAGKAFGGGNGGGNQTSTCALDNFTIKTEAATAAE